MSLNLETSNIVTLCYFIYCLHKVKVIRRSRSLNISFIVYTRSRLSEGQGFQKVTVRVLDFYIFAYTRSRLAEAQGHRLLYFRLCKVKVMSSRSRVSQVSLKIILHNKKHIDLMLLCNTWNAMTLWVFYSLFVLCHMHLLHTKS